SMPAARPNRRRMNFSKNCDPCWENPEKLARDGKVGCAAAQNRYFRRTFAVAQATCRLTVR
ncbi:hypothetical protein, partial [Mesorhizobium sp. M7A.F.Ca.CA.004.05.2.1]|uniref:hypothetical protein n=1 Tax=Mesorhizobium sp. M7A.F.Ca.CA.004.05.2.1 TaxID=2496716 RepID=UPI0019D07998